MSFELVDTVLKSGPAQSGDKLVLAAIASFVNNKSGRCDPSVTSIAERASMTERGARQIIRRLEEEGWLVVHQGGGRAGRSTYQINPERCSGLTVQNPEQRSPLSDDKPGTICPPPRNHIPPNPEPYSVNPERRSAEPVRTKKITKKGNPQTRMSARAEGPHPAADHLLSDAEADSFAALFDRWPKRTGEADARRAFAEVLADGVELEAIAMGAAAYVVDRNRDHRGPAAIVQFTAPLSRWLRERGWETWAGLPDAERAASCAAEEEREAMLERLRAQVALRNSMPF